MLNRLLVGDTNVFDVLKDFSSAVILKAFVTQRNCIKLYHRTAFNLFVDVLSGNRVKIKIIKIVC